MTDFATSLSYPIVGDDPDQPVATCGLGCGTLQSTSRRMSYEKDAARRRLPPAQSRIVLESNRETTIAAVNRQTLPKRSRQPPLDQSDFSTEACLRAGMPIAGRRRS